MYEVDADHAACVTRPELFNPVLLQACWSVTAAPARRGRQLAGQLTGRPVQLNPELLGYSSTT